MAAEQMADGPGTARRRRLRPRARWTPSTATSCDMLQTDGRASIRSVAERVHVSRANAYARINRLIDDGVIRGFSARVNHERAGQGASAYITLKIVQNSWRTVREQLQALPGAAHIALVSGDFDVLLLVHTPDNRTLRELVLTRIQAIPEVLSTRTLLVFEETDLDPGPVRPARPRRARLDADGAPSGPAVPGAGQPPVGVLSESVRRPVEGQLTTASATWSPSEPPPGCGRYHSTREFTMPKSSRVASRMSTSARRSPSAAAAFSRSATRWSNSRRRSMAQRSVCVLPRTRSSRVTYGSSAISTSTVRRVTYSTRSIARPRTRARLLEDARRARRAPG